MGEGYPKVRKKNSDKKKRGRNKYILAILVLVTITSIVWFYLNRQEKTFSTPRTRSMAVMYFENHTGDKNLDCWKKALPVSLIHSLMQLKSVRVVSVDQLQTTLRKLGISQLKGFTSKDLNRIMKQTGVDYIIYGYYVKAGNVLRIETNLRNILNENLAESKTVQGEGVETFLIAVDELVPWIISCLNLEDETSDDSMKLKN